eukprot:scaffold169332_cov17-Prasinocladus_malaysianus.AAC.1
MEKSSILWLNAITTVTLVWSVKGGSVPVAIMPVARSRPSGFNRNTTSGKQTPNYKNMLMYQHSDGTLRVF